MDVLITAAAVAVLGGLTLMAGLMGYRLWRAGMREEGALLMHRVLEREGVSLDGCTDKGTLATDSGCGAPLPPLPRSGDLSRVAGR